MTTRFPYSRIESVPVRLMLVRERRLDGESYLSDGFAYRCRLDSVGRTETVGTLARVWQPFRLKGIQVDAVFGAPFLAATQVFDIWPEPRKWLARSQIPNADELYVDAGCILVTRSGTVGTPIIAYGPHLNRIISDDLLRVQLYDERLRGYLYTFFRTRFGLEMMRSSHYGNVIKHLEPDHLAGLPVLLVQPLVAELDADIRDVFGMRDEAYALDLTARRRLEDEIGELPAPPDETGFSVDAGSLFSKGRRLDAYAHNPETVAVLDALKKGREVMSLGNVAAATQPSRFARVYGEDGIPYLSSDELFRINPEITKFLTKATDVDLSGLRVRAGWLLMSCSGQIYGLNGSVMLATAWHEDKVVTHDMIRIIPENVRPGYLQAVLAHPKLGRPLVLRNAYGTSIPHLESPDIARTPVVRLSQNIEDEIANYVERASELRMKADKKENGAVAKLEKRIDEALAVEGVERGRLKVNLPFDEAIKRALQVAPPEGGWADEQPAKRKRRKRG